MTKNNKKIVIPNMMMMMMTTNLEYIATEDLSIAKSTVAISSAHHGEDDDDDEDADGVVRKVMMGMVGPHGSVVGTPRSQ